MPKYRYTSTGKLQVEAKDEMKKRGVRSPDLADAFIMTFAAGGILYLMFQEIAPKVALKNSWLAPMGALLGFFIGVFGEALLG